MIHYIARNSTLRHGSGPFTRSRIVGNLLCSIISIHCSVGLPGQTDCHLTHLTLALSTHGVDIAYIQLVKRSRSLTVPSLRDISSLVWHFTTYRSLVYSQLQALTRFYTHCTNYRCLLNRKIRNKNFSEQV